MHQFPEWCITSVFAVDIQNMRSVLKWLSVIKGYAFNLIKRLASSQHIVFGDENGGVPIVACCSKLAIEKGFKAGQIVKLAASKLLGGGGGRDEMASGSGRDISKLDEAINAVKELIK